MTKRFCDTEIWQKDWFLNLSTKQKLLAKFLFDNCDCAGVYKISWKLLNLFFDEEITKEDIEKIKQVKFINEDTIYIEDFVLFQCSIKSLEDLNPNNNAHKGILKRLEKFNLYFRGSLGANEGLARGSLGAQEKEKEKDKEKDYSNSFTNAKLLNSNSMPLKEKENLTKEKEKKPDNSAHLSDIYFDKSVHRVFSLYKEHCRNLIPLGFESRNKDRIVEIQGFLNIVSYDFGYITELFKRANEQKTFYDNKINLKSLIKNHDSIYQGLGATMSNKTQGRTDMTNAERFKAQLDELTEKYRIADREEFSSE